MFRLIGKLALGTIGVGGVFLIGTAAGIVATGMAVIDDSETGEAVRDALKELKNSFESKKKDNEDKEELEDLKGLLKDQPEINKSYNYINKLAKKATRIQNTINILEDEIAKATEELSRAETTNKNNDYTEI